MKTSAIFLCIAGIITSAYSQPRPRGMEAIDLPEHKVSIFVEGNKRIIESNGIPNHTSGEFPTEGNPNAVRPLNYRFEIPVNPMEAKKTTAVERQPFGVAINGIPFDPGTAEYWRGNRDSGWRYDALSGNINLGIDHSNGHVQPTGAYHYHGIPNEMVKPLDHSNGMVLVGYAADGFPVYSEYGYDDPKDDNSSLTKVIPSYILKDGQRPNGPLGEYDGTFVEDFVYDPDRGDLDEHNGRFGVTPEYPKGIYHYFLTDTYPFIPRSYKGTPDQSFERKNTMDHVRGIGP